ncbi:hypothetical protein KL909_004348 [Ogataea angusta]|nr:hypothetical protein KL909_004348 [Ogataea angusta]
MFCVQFVSSGLLIALGGVCVAASEAATCTGSGSALVRARMSAWAYNSSRHKNYADPAQTSPLLAHFRFLS